MAAGEAGNAFRGKVSAGTNLSTILIGPILSVNGLCRSTTVNCPRETPVKSDQQRPQAVSLPLESIRGAGLEPVLAAVSKRTSASGATCRFAAFPGGVSSFAE